MQSHLYLLVLFDYLFILMEVEVLSSAPYTKGLLIDRAFLIGSRGTNHPDQSPNLEAIRHHPLPDRWSSFHTTLATHGF